MKYRSNAFKYLSEKRHLLSEISHRSLGKSILSYIRLQRSKPKWRSNTIHATHDVFQSTIYVETAGRMNVIFSVKWVRRTTKMLMTSKNKHDYRYFSILITIFLRSLLACLCIRLYLQHDIPTTYNVPRMSFEY